MGIPLSTLAGVAAIASERLNGTFMATSQLIRHGIFSQVRSTYFANKVCLVLYQDHNLKATQIYRLSDGEWVNELIEDLSNLLSLGICIESVTCDGSPSILKAVRECTPATIIQRYTVHVQREVLAWLTHNPKSVPGFELRKIVCRLNKITTLDEWGYWVVDLLR